MKKFIVSLSVLLFFAVIYSLTENSSYIKVMKIDSPCSVFIDTNKNLIFDETTPFEVSDVFFIDKTADYSNDKILSGLNETEKFFLNYFAYKTANDILKNKYVTINDTGLLVDDKSYSDILIQSGYFYVDNDESKQKLVDIAKSINKDDYVIVNTKSAKYHTLNCKEGQKGKNIKIIKRENLDKSVKGCKVCSLPQTKQEIQRKNEIKEYQINSAVPSVYEGQNIKIYFLDINKIWRPTSKCESNACIALKREIDEAESSIDFAIYGMGEQDEIFNALSKARNRGVKIRWVTDYDKKEGNYYVNTEKLKSVIKDFKTDEDYDNNNRAAIMHNKFFIFDEERVWTGSSNISGTDITEFNSNINVLIKSKEIAGIFKKEFEQMFSGKFHTEKEHFENKKIQLTPDTSVSAYFSPQDKPLRSKVFPLIREAREYIYIPVFFITKKEMTEELKNAYDRGVEIKIINDATNARSKYSIHKELRKHGIKVKTENFAGKMHTKSLIIDDKYSIIGSMNFTNNGEQRNDENLIIIENKDIAVYLKQCFLYLWNKIPEKYENYDPAPESFESTGSCHDGIDNDYDGKIDGKDGGCKRT